MKTIDLPCFGIRITLGPEDPDAPGTHKGGSIRSALHEGDDADPVNPFDHRKTAMDVIESLVLAHACAGIDVTSPPYVAGVETAVLKATNTYS
jgi:hypothetical protein